MSSGRHKQKSLNPRSWNGRMKGIPCFLLGNAPSINDMNLSLLDNYFTVGINRIFFTYDPTILMWQDLALWIQEKQKVMATKAIKFCREGSETIGGFYTFKLHGREPKVSPDLRQLYGRGSSGSVAYQFVYALGCNPIILIGMDCDYRKGLTDFYGKNSMHRPHTIPSCIKGLKFIDRSRGDRTIINCSYNKVFPIVSLEEAIKQVQSKEYTREELQNILLK